MSHICLYEPYCFPNILPEIKLTSKEIEEQVTALEYENDSFREDKAEAKYPIEIVPVFYRFITREQKIPSQNEFYEEARREMQIQGFDLDGQEDNYKHGLIARLKSRTYPSLIRDVHFCKLLEDNLSDDFEVFYNPTLDLLGIDILLKQEKSKQKYGICLYMDTYGGWSGVKRKMNYRKLYYNVEYIDFPKKRPANESGIWLYDESDIERLQQLIKNVH